MHTVLNPWRIGSLLLVGMLLSTCSSGVYANLILYINDPSVGSGNQTYEVVLMDGKMKDYVITSADTNFQALWGHSVTADDVNFDQNNDSFQDTVGDEGINVDADGLVLVNGRLINFDFSGELTAYGITDDGGGQYLYTKATVVGQSNTAETLNFAATRSFTFGEAAYYYWHDASGLATTDGVGDDSIVLGGPNAAMTTYGGIDENGQDFTLAHQYGGTPDVVDDQFDFGDGQYILPLPPGDGNVYLDGLPVQGGLYTMTANFTVSLSAGQQLEFQSTTFTITPEPASVGIWVVGGMFLMRRKLKSLGKLG